MSVEKQGPKKTSGKHVNRAVAPRRNIICRVDEKEREKCLLRLVRPKEHRLSVNTAHTRSVDRSCLLNVPEYLP